MINEENKLIDSLANMSDSQIVNLSKEVLCVNIKQLLVIIAKLDLRVVTKPVGPVRVLRVESSLPPDPTIVVEKKKEVGRAHD